jgi:hypothetical protein
MPRFDTASKCCSASSQSNQPEERTNTTLTAESPCEVSKRGAGERGTQGGQVAAGRIAEAIDGESA